MTVLFTRSGRSGKVVKVHHDDPEGLYYTINVGGREIQAEDKSLRRPSVIKPILVLGVAAVGLYYTSLPVVYYWARVSVLWCGIFYGSRPVLPASSRAPRVLRRGAILCEFYGPPVRHLRTAADSCASCRCRVFV